MYCTVKVVKNQYPISLYTYMTNKTGKIFRHKRNISVTICLFGDVSQKLYITRVCASCCDCCMPFLRFFCRRSCLVHPCPVESPKYQIMVMDVTELPHVVVFWHTNQQPKIPQKFCRQSCKNLFLPCKNRQSLPRFHMGWGTAGICFFLLYYIVFYIVFMMVQCSWIRIPNGRYSPFSR